MTQVKLWTYTGANSILPQVKKHLLSLKRDFIKSKHFCLKVKRGKNVQKSRLLWEQWKKAAQDRLDALTKLGVTVYYAPYHGVALFEFKVLQNSKPRKAYFVYYDSKDTIDEFIFHSVLEHKDKLQGKTHPIPERWMNEKTPYSL